MVVGQPLTLPTLNEYCAIAQKEVATSRVPARNVLMTDYQAFSRASPQVKPLETMQFVGYADAQKTRPRMISCKLHSAERIRAEYGATAAGEATTCARLNRRTLDAVMATMTDRQKKKMPFKGAGARDARAGPAWRPAKRNGCRNSPWCRPTPVAPCAFAPRAWAALAPAPASARVPAAGGGRQYCQLIAPDYLKRVLTGEVQLPKGDLPDGGRTVSR